MLALALLPSASATCAVDQTTKANVATVSIRALEAPVGCRVVTLSSTAPMDVQAWVWTPEDRKMKLPADHLRLLPGGGWEIAAPELDVGGRVLLLATLQAKELEVRLAPAPAPSPIVTRVDETRTFNLDVKHPGWGFADPTRASTTVVSTWTFPAGAPAQILPLPAGAYDIDAGGLAVVPNGVSVPMGTPAATLKYTVPGAAPRGDEPRPAGALTLVGDVRFVAPLGAPVEGGVRFDTPEGGRARWRVVSAANVAVIPDVETFVAGVDWHFAQASLPEPAVPVRLKGLTDRAAMYTQLLAEVRALRDGHLPSADPLRPRQLNGAWRSGWATPVERALILHRFLTQEKMTTTWLATGQDADVATFTGFDTLLLTTKVGERTVWTDPGCGVCAEGEIRTRWATLPAVGVQMVPTKDRPAVPVFDGSPKGFAFTPVALNLPRAEGRLGRSLALVGEHFEATFTARGAAALWLRESIFEVAPPLRGARIAEVLGFAEGELLETAGFEVAGAPITVRVRGGARPPADPFPTHDGTPWAGGWGDE